MAESSGDDALLVKIAVFGIVMSVMCTAFITVLFVENGSDYTYEDIQQGREELSQFTGQSMLNQTPWVLTGIYTPWVSTDGTDGHIDEDGWLYGTAITTSEGYSYIGKSADIKLDAEQKSNVPITVNDSTVSYKYVDGHKWWAGQHSEEGNLSPIGKFLVKYFNADPYTYESRNATIWNYTGYRYTFDPTLPFSTKNPDSGTVSTRDGKLSLVWYSYNGQEGLSGGLQIYGGRVLLSSYSAADIITAYNSSSGYATSYDFDFEGTVLTLSIRFDQDVIDSGTALMQAWVNGNWSLAISSVSAGNFFDLDDSLSFSSTAGSMIKTFISIYTFDMPQIDNAWAQWILWALVGLPMTMAMLCVTLRLINGFRTIV